jgi:hypothetical protein
VTLDDLPALRAEAARKRKLYFAEQSAWRAVVNARCEFDSATYPGARADRLATLCAVTATWLAACIRVKEEESSPQATPRQDVEKTG